MTDTKVARQAEKRAAKARRAKQPTQSQRTAALQAATERTRNAMPVMAPAEQERHHTIEQRGSTDTPGRSGQIVRDQRWLDRYALDGRITERQYEAGRRLYETWMATGLNPKVIGDYGTTIDGGGTEGAEQRQQRALNEMVWVKRNLDYWTWEVLQAVVIWDQPVWSPHTPTRCRHGREHDVLCAALTRLANLWKI